MFAGTGFDGRRDIAGIVANRWGHAYCVTPPGFFFDRPGRTAPSNVIRQRHGRVAFGNSDLAGCQTWEIAVSEGQRATRQVLERL
jgi:spermidine dehydrogenase